MKTAEQYFHELDDFTVKARNSHAYHAESASLEFTENLLRRMDEVKISRSELAAKIGVKPAYITKILRGDTNFTLETMVKLALALDCQFHCHLKPHGSEGVWIELNGQMPTVETSSSGTKPQRIRKRSLSPASA